MIEAEDRDTAVQSFIGPSELIRVTAFERFKSEPCAATALSNVAHRGKPSGLLLRARMDAAAHLGTQQSKKCQEKRLNMAHGDARVEMFRRQPASTID